MIIDTILSSYFDVVSSSYFQVISAIICIVLVLDVIYSNFKGD